MKVFGNLDKSSFRGGDNQNLVSVNRGKLECEKAFKKLSLKCEGHGRRGYEVQGEFCLKIGEKKCLYANGKVQ